ncbi:MAG TPA: WG repeat-containing protein, partial [Chroococcales cyanobacterium]
FLFLFDASVIDVGDFHEGLAAVKMELEPHYDESGSLRLTGVGFVNKTGALVIKPIYLPLNENSLDDTYFSGGAACLQKGAWRGMIDRSGHIVMPFVYPYMRPFHSGLAACVVLKDDTGKIISVNDTAHGFQSKAAYTDACAQSLQQQLKEFRSKEIVRFHFRLDIPTNETVFITHGSDAKVKKALTAAIKAMKRPPLGCRMDYNGPLDLVIKDGKVGVAFTRTDPMAQQILTRIKLWRQQRTLDPNSKEWHELDKKIKELSDQIGDDSLTVPGA